MHRFEVWAPGRRSVDVVLDGRRVAMTERAGGWWERSDAESGPGTRYGFSLDGGAVRPDPRSASQPEGVLALSQVVDHAARRWTDAGWAGRPLAGLVFYELHVGTFSSEGTFAGAIDRLDELVQLGVDAIEVMPVAEFAGARGWGYDGVDLFAPHHAYGGPEGFKRLVEAAHARGLAVVLDVVYNHLGPAGNFLSEFGPYFTDRHHTDWGAALNFDGADAREVRRFVVDNATMWIRDYHVDGLRLDAVHAIVDDSPVHILDELAGAVEAAGGGLGRTVFVVAESGPNVPRLVLSRADGGFGFDAVWADDWHHSLHAFLTGERAGYYAGFGSLDQLAKALRQAWIRGPEPAGLAPHQLVVAAQNHDQVGNRATGDRLGTLVGDGKAKIAAALLLTSPFTPLVFQGEEWGASTPFQYFTDHDRELGRAVSEGRRREFARFGWKADEVPDPQDPATFERSKLRWDERERPPHREMLDWYRRLLALRRNLPPPGERVGEGVEVQVDCDARRLAFVRPGLAVYVNLGREDWRLPGDRGGEPVMSSAGTFEVVAPDGVAVFRIPSHRD